MKQRKVNRLPGYDYSQEGLYFITICTKDKIKWFGKIENGEMKLNKYGIVAEKYWKEIPEHYYYVQLLEFIIMPNHVHGIIYITSDVGTEHCSVPTIINNNHYGLLSKIIKSFKEKITKIIHNDYKNYNFHWQRSFYDHIIRNEKSLNQIRQYIVDNPITWEFDEENIMGIKCKNQTTFFD